MGRSLGRVTTLSRTHRVDGGALICTPVCALCSQGGEGNRLGPSGGFRRRDNPRLASQPCSQGILGLEPCLSFP